MARAPKTEQAGPNGMSMLTVMPFPAFNPLNWWALASPRNAMLASVHTARLALDAWRAGADSVRAMMRLQQDEVLKLLQAETEGPETAAEEAEHEAEVEDSEAAAALFVQPMIEATRAYGRVGKAFIVAQRDSLRAFAPAQRTAERQSAS